MSTVMTPDTNETVQPESALRFDLAAIARWVQPEERVLDLGVAAGHCDVQIGRAHV